MTFPGLTTRESEWITAWMRPRSLCLSWARGADWVQLLQKGCEFSSVLLPNRDNWQDLRQVWHWHYCLSPQHTLYGRVLSPEFMHFNCNQIPAGSRASQRAAVRLQDDKATSLLWRTISLIACYLNIFSAFSTVCRERTLAYCAA